VINILDRQNPNVVVNNIDAVGVSPAFLNFPAARAAPSPDVCAFWGDDKFVAAHLKVSRYMRCIGTVRLPEGAVATLGRRNGGFGWIGTDTFAGTGDGGGVVRVLLTVHGVLVCEGQFTNRLLVEFFDFSGGFRYAINVVGDARSGAGNPGKFHRVRWPAVQQ